MNPPNVYELTMPNSHRIISKTAIVQSIGTPFVDILCCWQPATPESVRRRSYVRYPAKALAEVQSRFTLRQIRRQESAFFSTRDAIHFSIHVDNSISQYTWTIPLRTA